MEKDDPRLALVTQALEDCEPLESMIPAGRQRVAAYILGILDLAAAPAGVVTDAAVQAAARAIVEADEPWTIDELLKEVRALAAAHAETSHDRARAVSILRGKGGTNIQT